MMAVMCVWKRVNGTWQIGMTHHDPAGQSAVGEGVGWGHDGGDEEGEGAEQDVADGDVAPEGARPSPNLRRFGRRGGGGRDDAVVVQRDAADGHGEHEAREPDEEGGLRADVGGEVHARRAGRGHVEAEGRHHDDQDERFDVADEGHDTREGR